MKLLLEKIPRIFKIIAFGKEYSFKDYGGIELEDNSMLALISERGKKHEITSKDWGFYATQSINGRLVDYGFKTALVKNEQGKAYIMLVEKDKQKQFQEYIEVSKQKIVEFLDERKF